MAPEPARQPCGGDDEKHVQGVVCPEPPPEVQPHQHEAQDCHAQEEDETNHRLLIRGQTEDRLAGRLGVLGVDALGIRGDLVVTDELHCNPFQGRGAGDPQTCVRRSTNLAMLS